MDVVKEMLYKALRDDSTATIGIRALLGHSATPWGVYHANIPDNPDFSSSKKYITFYQLTGDYDTTYPRHNFSTMPKQETYQFTVWGGDSTTTCDAILKRIRHRLEGKRSTTDPSSDAIIYRIECEWESPDLWDDDYRANYKQVRYRVWLNDTTNAT